MTRDTDIAWCAGFFDGEGHVSYTRSYPHPNSGKVTCGLRCSVPQSADNIEVLKEFQRVVGLGKIMGPYPMGKAKLQYRLIFATKEIEPLFMILIPYLKHEKSSDFRNALLAYEAHDCRPTADDYARLRRRDEKKVRKLG